MPTDVRGADFRRIGARHNEAAPTFVLKNVEGFGTHDCWPLADVRLERVNDKRL